MRHGPGRQGVIETALCSHEAVPLLGWELHAIAERKVPCCGFKCRVPFKEIVMRYRRRGQQRLNKDPPLDLDLTKCPRPVWSQERKISLAVVCNFDGG